MISRISLLKQVRILRLIKTISFFSSLIFALALSPVFCEHRSGTSSINKIKKLELLSGHKILSSECNDLDNNGIIETVLITYKSKLAGHLYGGDVIVLNKSNNKIKVLWRQSKLNPWKLQLADVDGDNVFEVIVGVWKKSPKDQVMAKRVFIYSWNGQRLIPKWLGSRLSRRFDDFIFSDINGDGFAELISLEIMPNKKHRVSVYRWSSFGFYQIGHSKSHSGLLGLKQNKDIIVAYGQKSSFYIVSDKHNVYLKKIKRFLQ